MAQESYYYCQGKKVFLPKNERVRYVGFKNTLSGNQAKSIRDNLSSCCTMIYEHTPFFAKYFISEDKIEQFDAVVHSNDSLICLNSPNYASDDTLMLYPTRTILVKVKPSISLLPILNNMKVPYDKVIQSKYNSQEYKIALSSDVALQFAALLYETGAFEYAQPNFNEQEYNTGYQDNPEYQYQWAVHNNVNMNLLPAWSFTSGHPQIKVAILDDGVDINHPDLTDNLLEGYDAVDDPNHPSPNCCCGENESDYDFHGTLCIGVIGASNNEEGLVGVAHTSKVIPIRIFHRVIEYFRDITPGTPTFHLILVGERSWKIDAFDHACYEDKADVISCSFTTKAEDPLLNKISEVCQNGRNGKGCVVVVSSGNQEHTFPNPLTDAMGPFSNQSCVISVGGINECGERMRYGHYCDIDSGYNSCYGDSLDVVAPGIHVPSTMINGEYTRAFGGTSAAAPHVAGVAALVLSVNPCLTREEVKYVIESTCTKIRPDLYNYTTNPDHPNGTWNIEVGYGLVNAYAAVQKAQQMGGYTYIKDTIVSGNITWTGNKMIHDSLVVDSLAALTVEDTIYMSSAARFIVRPGGKLIVDGGTITSACDGEMWPGIEVVGDRTKNQTAANQGVVELRNGATIENALCGIYTGLRGDTDFATTGGIVSASDAVFRNNARAVEINSYAGTAPAGTVADNLCAFENCTFTIDSANLFAANNTSFAEHVRLWDVKAVKFKGCTFENRTHGATSGGRGIYADDAGVKIDVMCADDNVVLPGYCGCPPALSDSCLFTGFATAVEVVTSGTPYAVTIDRAAFTGNTTGVRINGNPFATVTRCDFALPSGTQTAWYLYGLRLDGCSGFKVEANRFNGVAQLPGGSTVGIYVGGSGSAANTLYRNQFDNLTYGVYAAGGNSGLQIQCNEFDSCGTNIYVSTRSSIASSQGSTRTSAGNKFQQTFGFDIRNGGSQDIYYYYKNTASNGYANPSLTSGIVYVGESSSANSCPSTLCSTLPGPTPFLLAGFQSGMNAYTAALAGNNDTDGLDNADGAGVETQNFASLQQAGTENLPETAQSLSATYHAAVRSLMADSLLDLNELEQWHTAAQPLADPYSLTETRFVEGYAEAFAADMDDAELANYAEFHAMKMALRGDNNDNVDNQDNSGTPVVNWYALTPAQIAQLQAIAERNTGRASVMAKGVLCFFHGNCYEDDLLVNDNMDNWDNTGDGEMAGKRAKRVTTDITEDNALTVYPNPTNDLLHIELAGGAGIASAALFDLQGRAVRTRFIASASSQTATVDVRGVPAGVYMLRVTDGEGKEYGRKVVKR